MANFTLVPIELPTFEISAGPIPIKLEPCPLQKSDCVCAFYHDPFLKGGMLADIKDSSFPPGAPCFVCQDSTWLVFAGLMTKQGINPIDKVLKWCAKKFPEVQERANKKCCYATRIADPKMLTAALDAGAQVDYREEEMGLRTALHQCARGSTVRTAIDALKCTTILLAYRADVMQVDGKGWSCIQQHAYAGSAESLEQLLRKAPGSCLTEKTPLGQTLQDLASEDEDKIEALHRARQRFASPPKKSKTAPAL